MSTSFEQQRGPCKLASSLMPHVMQVCGHQRTLQAGQDLGLEMILCSVELTNREHLKQVRALWFGKGTFKGRPTLHP